MSLLITRPRHDSLTHYLYYWSQSIIEEAKKKHFDIYDMKVGKATKKKVESYLKKKNPEIIVFNGHGSSTCVTGHDNEEIIIANHNSILLKNKKVFIRSCDSGKILGMDLIKNGANGFIGYSEPYFLPYDKDYFSKPLKDNLAGSFLECSNQVGISLIKGHSVEEAHQLSLNVYKRKLSEMLTSEANGNYIWMLMSNMRSQVCYVNN